MHYREFAGIRRHAELFDAFAARYQALAEDNGLDWLVEDLRPFPTAAEQLAYLAAQGYLDG
jgi:phosphoglycolate phosphatase-like HAD superfamily hydrolase